MARDTESQESKLHDQQYARGEEVTLGAKFLFSPFCSLIGIQTFALVSFCTWTIILAHCSAHICLPKTISVEFSLLSIGLFPLL